MLGKFSASVISLKLSLQIFSQVLCLFFFWDPYNADFAAFNVLPDLLGCIHLFSFFFSIFCSVVVVSTILSSQSFIRSSASVILLLIPSSVFTWNCWSKNWRRKWQPTPVFLRGESQGWGSLVGCHLWVGHD